MSEHDWQTHAKLAAVAIRGIADRIEQGKVSHYNCEAFYDPNPIAMVSLEERSSQRCHIVRVTVPREAVNRLATYP